MLVLIIGPKDTPYEKGAYFFDIKFAPDHPFKSPVAKFLTSDNKVRFNPNLYINGKVCLSILGTWSGPSWTPLIRMETLFLTI